MDKAIAAAEEKTRKIAASEKEMRYYEALEDARRNMISSMNYQWEQGYREGEAEGKAEGETRLAALMERLIQDNRLEELQQALKDPELRKSLFKEFEIE